MRTKLRRILAIFMAVVTITATVAGCGGDSDKGTDTTTAGNLLTRGQWIEMLGKGFGMDEYTGTEAYYKDVNEKDEIYAYVQSCYEWDILSTGTDEFKPNDIATLGFVITTSVLAAELDYDEYIEDDDVNAAIIKCAKANKIYDIEPGDSELTSGVTEIEASTILEATNSSYFESDEEEICQVTYTDMVKELDDEQIKSKLSNGENNFSEDEAQNIENGDVFVLDASDMYPNGVALKVINKVKNPDGTYTFEFEVPEIYEVFDEVEINKTVMADPNSIIPAKGVTITTATEGNNADSAVYINDANISNLRDADTNISKTYDAVASKKFCAEVSIGGDGFSASTSLSNSLLEMDNKIAEASVEDDEYRKFKEMVSKTGVTPTSIYYDTAETLVDKYKKGEIDSNTLEQKLKAQQEKYKNTSKSKAEKLFEGVKITGKIEGQIGVDVNVGLDFYWIGVEVEEFSISVFDDITTSLTIEGEIGESIDILNIPIPIGAGFTVNAVMHAFINLDGSISYSYQIKNSVGVKWEDGKFKQFSEKETSNSLEFATSLEVGLQIGMALELLSYDIAECGLSLSIKGEVASALSKVLSVEKVETDNLIITTDKLVISTEVKAILPIISFYVGGDDTLLSDIGIDKEFDIISEDQAPKIPIWSDEAEIILYQETVPLRQGEEDTTVQETTTEEVTTDGETVVTDKEITLSTFALSMTSGGTETIIPYIPEGYSEGDLQWSTSDASVATVSAGKITAKASGSATITVKTKDGQYTGKCIVVVE